MKNCILLLFLAAAQVVSVLAHSQFGRISLPLLVGSKHENESSLSYHVHDSDTIEDLEQNAPDEFIEEIVDRIAGYTAGKDIIPKYHPTRTQLWRRWKGTVFQHGLLKSTLNMIITIVINRILSRGRFVPTGQVDTQNAFISQLEVFDKIWKYLLTLTTFILTFFLSEAYKFWKDMYTRGRVVQGRINDIGFLLATHAKRDSNGNYTKNSITLLDEAGALLRLYSPFLWASTSRRYRVLLTDRGLKKMVARGILSQAQMDALLISGVPRSQFCNIILEWSAMRVNKARKNGLLPEFLFSYPYILDKFCILRGTGAGIGDAMDGRMPIVYAHFVQVLVDCFIVGAPLALYAELGSMSFICVFMLSLFYEGLLDLAKVFLDPLENEDYCENIGVEIDLGVLTRESNAGSIRWKKGASAVPFKP